MKEFEDWWGKYTPDSEQYVPPITVPHDRHIAADAFRAGMLASADIAKKLWDRWSEEDYHKPPEMTLSRSVGAEAIEFAIREAAK